MATTADVLKEVRKIYEILNRIEQAEAARIEREKEFTHKLEVHDKAIHGNGTAGLKTEVRLLQESMGRVNWIGALFTAAIIADIASRLLAK